MDEKRKIWTMVDEKRFISELGIKRRSSVETPRKELLSKYLESMEARTEWGRLNRFEILINAQNQYANA
jgi:hypothetical protein